MNLMRSYLSGRAGCLYRQAAGSWNVLDTLGDVIICNHLSASRRFCHVPEPSIGFHEVLWDSMRFHEIPWGFMRFYDVPVNQSVLTEANRDLTSYIYQFKIGHGYNKAYLHRINKVDSPNCSCDTKQTLEHLPLSCKWYKYDCQILQQDLDYSLLTLPQLLHTTRGIEATLAFILCTRVGIRKLYLDLDQDPD
jgi:hypothetical protein